MSEAVSSAEAAADAEQLRVLDRWFARSRRSRRRCLNRLRAAAGLPPLAPYVRPAPKVRRPKTNLAECRHHGCTRAVVPGRRSCARCLARDRGYQTRHNVAKRICSECGGPTFRGSCADCQRRWAASCLLPAYAQDRRTGRDRVGTYSAALGWALVLHRERHAA